VTHGGVWRHDRPQPRRTVVRGATATVSRFGGSGEEPRDPTQAYHLAEAQWTRLIDAQTTHLKEDL